MTGQTLYLDDALYHYLQGVSLRETPLLARLRAETQALPEARWQVAPEQGQLLALLIRLIGARRVIEVGTFTGYSALCMAQAMDGGICCVATCQAITTPRHSATGKRPVLPSVSSCAWGRRCKPWQHSMQNPST